MNTPHDEYDVYCQFMAGNESSLLGENPGQCKSPGQDKQEIIRLSAIGLLARREHSQRELEQKLRKRFSHWQECSSLCEQVIANLVEENLQSDDRFCEVLVNNSKRRGLGPNRIRTEMRDRCISEGLVSAYIDDRDKCWLELASSVREKKFPAWPTTDRERAKQSRFLHYRGFTAEHISQVFLQD